MANARCAPVQCSTLLSAMMLTIVWVAGLPLPQRSAGKAVLACFSGTFCICKQIQGTEMYDYEVLYCYSDKFCKLDLCLKQTNITTNE
jgi:hypothetical protein